MGRFIQNKEAFQALLSMSFPNDGFWQPSSAGMHSNSFDSFFSLNPAILVSCQFWYIISLYHFSFFTTTAHLDPLYLSRELTVLLVTVVAARLFPPSMSKDFKSKGFFFCTFVCFGCLAAYGVLRPGIRSELQFQPKLQLQKHQIHCARPEMKPASLCSQDAANPVVPQGELPKAKFRSYHLR